MASSKANPKPKQEKFEYMGVAIYWAGVRVCKAQYKGLELEIRGNGGYSRSLYIDGRKAHSGETIDALKQYACEYLRGV